MPVSKAVEAAFKAIKNDNPDIVIEITKANENILWSSTDPEESTSLFACAVTNRQEKVAQFLRELGASTGRNIVNFIDEDGNNMLHVAAKLAPHSKSSHISGPALQLQSELRWFESVRAIVPWPYKEQKNNAGETPFQVFAREHKDLLKEAEEWMKKTAESSTVVGALIITIMFAAAFTVPGVLMFLGILTPRYGYQDFLISLPLKWMIGACSLFISIATMAVAFCASLFIMLKGRLVVFIPITLLAVIPVILFMLVQSKLVLEIYSSTCRSHIFGPSFATTLGKYVRSRLFISRMFIRRPIDD
ncbi:hypothetical protein SLEP1_g38594 [Rubroshorea leprosula]|uniref:PGG domain-containing protein n=1 Tax=Rubroshorea leprosula TaxID=152421 RepID=A0AAV5KXV0_9ROSI|nr:hypothetical protein SLEP1_g38594 [Rubroshorea leprosula]